MVFYYTSIWSASCQFCSLHALVMVIVSQIERNFNRENLIKLKLKEVVLHEECPKKGQLGQGVLK